MMLGKNRGPRASRGFTLIELVMAIAISGVVLGGIVAAYIQAARRAEWTGYSLAAHALAIQQLEQARSAKWDILSVPIVDEITNLARVTAAVLDLPISGTNVVRATNYASVSQVVVSATPRVTVYMVQVNTVWPFRGQLHTNTLAGYFAPD